MEIKKTTNLKKKTSEYLKHATIIMIISTAIFSSFGASVYATSSSASRILSRGSILLIRNTKSTNLLADDLKKKKTYKINDRIEILSDLTGEPSEKLKEKIQNGKTTLELAAEYGVLDEYNTLVLEAYNCSLEELCKCGRLSAEECAEMYNNADLTFLNTADLISEELETENTDNSAADPTDTEKSKTELAGPKGEEHIEVSYEIAKKYGKLSDFKDYLFENLISNIDAMLERNEITELEADNMIADFENEFLQNCK